MRKQKTPNTNIQTSLDTLLDLLEEQPGVLHKLQVGADDIGAELLAVLTKGLYTNPLDCVREYVQNAVDAKAKSITIKITGNSVSIFDDGSGMSLEDLIQSRQFGLSMKFVSEHVGFRGIGIYSGFDICRRLRITSKKADDPNLHVLVFEFEAMKTQLENERGVTDKSQKTSLIDLLSAHTYIKREASNFPIATSFTQIELHDINDFHIRQLNNRAELRRYLLQNLPIDFADSFKHGKDINAHLIAVIRGFSSVRITLQSDGIDDEVVEKYTGVSVQAPTYGYILHPTTKQQIAFYWASLNNSGERVDANSLKDAPKYEGFVYKVKGFTIGDRQKLRSMFATRDQVYNWYTGEIYVLDSNITPNAERNDFESGPPKQALELSVLEKFDKELKPAALSFQANGRAVSILSIFQAQFLEISDKLAGNPTAGRTKPFENTFDIYSQLQKIADDLKKRKRDLNDASKRQEADDLVKAAEKLKAQLLKDAGSSAPQAARQKAVAKGTVATPSSPSDEQPTLPQFTAPPVIRTLISALKDGGWDIDEPSLEIIDHIQKSIENILGTDGKEYRQIISDFENRLSSSSDR